jgi:hypothetical protein
VKRVLLTVLLVKVTAIRGRTLVVVKPLKAGSSSSAGRRIEGNIAGSCEEALFSWTLVTDAELPEGDALKGRWMSLTVGARTPGRTGEY